LRATRVAEGIRISWIRRARLGGDSWDALEVPLNESVEAYRVEILIGDEAVRTFEVGTQQATYATADELIDFGAPQDLLSVRVAQLSPVAGIGRATRETLRL
jgi:hypothetical protein